MTERGICMTPASVVAIRERRKTQTRRRIKLNIAGPLYLMSSSISPQWGGGPPGVYFCDSQNIEETCQHLFVRCPYVPGDLLYIREACWMWGAWRKNGLTTRGRQRWRFKPRGERVVYECPTVTAKRDGSTGWVYRHERYMPKKYARTWVEITDVRVELLCCISREDAQSEGFDSVEDFARLWDTLHRKDGLIWQTNPWIWVVTFRQISH